MVSKDEKLMALAQIIDALCIELKKDNSIAARRKQAKLQREKKEAILKGNKDE